MENWSSTSMNIRNIKYQYLLWFPLVYIFLFFSFVIYIYLSRLSLSLSSVWALSLALCSSSSWNKKIYIKLIKFDCVYVYQVYQLFGLIECVFMKIITFRLSLEYHAKHSNVLVFWNVFTIFFFIDFHRKTEILF